MNIKFVSSLILLLALSAGPAHAEKNWWDQGADILKQIKNNKKDRPSTKEISSAFKEALRIGSKNVVNKLGTIDGFNADPAIHIPIPEKLKSVKKILTKIGMRKDLDKFELTLNRAAEAATPKAKIIFLNAINEVSFKDVKTIYKGSDDSATQYFQQKMTPALRTEMRTLIEASLADVGAIKSYRRIMKKYKRLPFVRKVKVDITEYVVNKGISGIFYYLAKEEAAIRKDPAKRTTKLLQKVFGAAI